METVFDFNSSDCDISMDLNKPEEKLSELDSDYSDHTGSDLSREQVSKHCHQCFETCFLSKFFDDEDVQMGMKKSFYIIRYEEEDDDEYNYYEYSDDDEENEDDYAYLGINKDFDEEQYMKYQKLLLNDKYEEASEFFDSYLKPQMEEAEEDADSFYSLADLENLELGDQSIFDLENNKSVNFETRTKV